MNPDDLISQWEIRNAKNLLAEEAAAKEARRVSRLFAFTRVDLMRATLSEAAYRTAVALGIPPDKCRAALVPDPETKRYKPGIEIDKDVITDEGAVRAVFGFAFRQVHDEWGFDLAYAEADSRFAPKLAENMKIQESLGSLAQRIKTWLG